MEYVTSIHPRWAAFTDHNMGASETPFGYTLPWGPCDAVLARVTCRVMRAWTGLLRNFSNIFQTASCGWMVWGVLVVFFFLFGLTPVDSLFPVSVHLSFRYNWRLHHHGNKINSTLFRKVEKQWCFVVLYFILLTLKANAFVSNIIT